jgi:hypothetical protein
MSDQTDTGGALWDAPNQQVVRADQSHPSQEGTGGSSRQDTSGTASQEETASDDEPASEEKLNEMTKSELLEYARSQGVSPANNDMTKEELRAGIDAKLAER